jgi:hypothetical protein
LHLAIGDMMEQLLAQGDEEIRSIARTLFYFRNIEDGNYPKRCYEAIIALSILVDENMAAKKVIGIQKLPHYN